MGRGIPQQCGIETVQMDALPAFLEIRGQNGRNVLRLRMSLGYRHGQDYVHDVPIRRFRKVELEIREHQRKRPFLPTTRRRDVVAREALAAMPPTRSLLSSHTFASSGIPPSCAYGFWMSEGSIDTRVSSCTCAAPCASTASCTVASNPLGEKVA